MLTCEDHAGSVPEYDVYALFHGTEGAAGSGIAVGIGKQIAATPAKIKVSHDEAWKQNIYLQASR